MDDKQLDRLSAMMVSDNDGEALMALRALQSYVREHGVDFRQAMSFWVTHLPQMKGAAAAPALPEAASTMPTPVVNAGLPQCRTDAGSIEILPAGASSGEKVLLPAAAAAEAGMIAENLKDAIVAAVINKSRMKLKLLDNRNARGEVVETTLQAEYERDGMMPVQIWINARGEVAALAAVLRRALANAVPDVMVA